VTVLSVRALLGIATVSRAVWSRFRAESFLWRAVGRAKLAQLVPAKAFYDGPWNPSRLLQFDPDVGRFSLSSRDSRRRPDKTGRRPRLLFPSCAAIADESLAAAVAEAGPAYAGCEWTWREAPVCFADKHWQSDGGRAVACSGGEAVGIAAASCAIPAAAGPASHAEFGALTCAFQCGECPDAAFAERQCACCGILLCLECAYRCEYDGLRNPRLDPEFSRALSRNLQYSYQRNCDRQRCAKTLEQLSLGEEVAHCAFALCSECIESSSFLGGRPSRDDVLDMDGGEPGLALPICHVCSPRLLCPAHVQCCVRTCEVTDYTFEGCGKAVCVYGPQTTCDSAMLSCSSAGSAHEVCNRCCEDCCMRCDSGVLLCDADDEGVTAMDATATVASVLERLLAPPHSLPDTHVWVVDLRRALEQYP
jgi:hypothetical protein